MTIEAMKHAMPLYTAYKQAETLLIMLNSPISKVDCNCASVSIPPELAEPVRAAVVATVEQERDRLKAELEAL
jgi:hypothetical protein